MCRPVECMVCHKTTWAGCGAHVQQVMSAVPPERQCKCSRDDAPSPGGGGSLWDAISRAVTGRPRPK